MDFNKANDTSPGGRTFNDIAGEQNTYNIGGNLSIGAHELGTLHVVPHALTCLTNSGTFPLLDAASLGAAFNSRQRAPPANPGTREEVLEAITGRTDEETMSTTVFWLHGPAGAGKSAIARTLADACAERKILAASFFFWRGRPGRDSIDRLFTTIA
ncbi:putative NACHT domain containing protein [Lyophyllum shimeji]|uniref:NACHT domain containing protein n=1 Tax=Lyophyllum shimeji TaxID=47721 RepID=A0A9P3PTE7_LYOSH|nr:putative NACHT domain containing protein [Lyophyllum shimeji]